MKRRRAAAGAALAVALGLLGWWSLRAEPPASVAGTAALAVPLPRVTAAEAADAAIPAAAAASAASGILGRPLSALGEGERRALHALWQQRLARAQAALDTYERIARYPHESRPAEEHADQLRPFDPIAEDRALRLPGGSATQGVHLRTTQERVFAAGAESSRITLSLQDDAGRLLPLRVTRAVLHEVTLPGRTASTPEFVMPVNDSGHAGDLVAGDGVLSALIHPLAQGFASYSGLLRLELSLDYAGQPGYLYFDLVYSPEQAARWLPGVGEAIVDGSLEFSLKAEVLMPGRYVVSARIDDASGKPLAIAMFNGELAAGPRVIRLPVFGKLLRDRQAAFPLRLRDVEAFLLKPDAFPDRVMLPRLLGLQHSSRSYALTSFPDTAWQSEERERYLAELGKDVQEAQRGVAQTGP